jgi:hypothetical protein
MKIRNHTNLTSQNTRLQQSEVKKMSNGNVKTYKNPARNEAVLYKPYVPQYLILGRDPSANVMPAPELNQHTTKLEIPETLPKDNPRASRAPIRQPYAELVQSPIGKGKGFLPNVGNNVEQTWSSLEGDVIDDIDLNLDMVDNNEFVDIEDVEEQSKLELKTFDKVKSVKQLELTVDDKTDIYSCVKSLEEGDYLLLINEMPVCSGDLDVVQAEAKSLVFGDHSICNGNPIPIDDILVIKRVKLKVGLFLE